MPNKIKEQITDGILHLTLCNTRGNILDGEMMGEITSAIEGATRDPHIKAITFRGEGDHFSFGASVPEHQKDRVAEMLASFHKLFRTLISFSRPTIAIVRGQCLGGGMELAAFCHWIFAHEKAQFGQPEIQLAVFPPVASLALPLRIGQPMSDDLNLTGRSIGAEEAYRIGLVQHISPDPDTTASEFIRQHIIPKSASSLRIATTASRRIYHEQFLKHIDALEAMYLQELMVTHDANEGINAFMQKRKPEWQNR